MKHTALHLTLITALTMFCNNIVAMFMPSIYLENHYGADIEYKTDLGRVNVPSHLLHNQERHELGKIGRVPFLSLKTLRIGSAFTDIPDIMRTLMQEARLNQHKNAVIIIKPSRMYQKWDLSINWESMDTEVIDMDHSIIEIIKKNLGNVYAQKAEDILEYDYTKATKAGFINLEKSLITAVENVGKQIFTKEPRRQTPLITPDVSTFEDLKDTIDQLHRALQRYKVRDNQ